MSTKVMTQEEIRNTVWHMGRAWTGHAIEDECPCPQEACGLVSSVTKDDECPQHGFGASKTTRQGHPEQNCPGHSE